jgi:hypothetical protein
MGPTIMMELADLAGACTAAHQTLLERVSTVAAEHGLEVLHIGPAPDGAWDLRVRPLPAGALPPAFEEPGGRRIPDRPPEPPFLSPVRASVPFDGNGTGELLTFLANADRAVCVPAPGPGRRGALPWLSDEERLRMLPGTIAGDALLSLQHQGLHGDPAAVAAALAQGREHFSAEVSRAGVEGPAEFLSLYDEAAALARHRVLGAA